MSFHKIVAFGLIGFGIGAWTGSFAVALKFLVSGFFNSSWVVPSGDWVVIAIPALFCSIYAILNYVLEWNRRGGL